MPGRPGGNRQQENPPVVTQLHEVSDLGFSSSIFVLGSRLDAVALEPTIQRAAAQAQRLRGFGHAAVAC